MDAFVIEGGRPMNGRVVVNGSKNAALPLMAAALMTEEPVTLTDIPRLADIANMRRLLEELGCECAEPEHADDDAPMALTMRTTDDSGSHARYEIVKTMRAGICVLGPLLARRGEGRVSLPGGCAIGQRPVDLHLRGLAALGAEITLTAGDIVAQAPVGPDGARRLRGATVFLGGPNGSTVLGTANVMSAACLAEGRTVIECAACEPEVVDLAKLLNAMGARIEGAGTPRVTIDGVRTLHGATHRVMPDRIEAGTYMVAAAITGGSVTIENCPLDAMMAVTDRLREIGVRLDTRTGEDPMRAVCRASAEGPIAPAHVTTQPHPGFPTDLQAQFMALLSLAEGNSVVTEKIFPERFLHVAELTRMGAHIFRQGPTAVISGVRRLVGAPVMASDLRASACLVLAALAAEGTTNIHRVYHLDRGYQRMETRLRALGASIERVDANELDAAALT
ncbi:MAG: UDP-N-acetylglucosamine 1-carboxyvinyltransferase [Phycisphaerales bacterium]|nr:MAG: UDP-N-acetylglucosamine 1-carboxyvinyltransferase [Phycisphaerales bacterium]